MKETAKAADQVAGSHQVRRYHDPAGDPGPQVRQHGRRGSQAEDRRADRTAEHAARFIRRRAHSQALASSRKNSTDLGDSIADKQGILERATGEGDGEGGKGGFEGDGRLRRSRPKRPSACWPAGMGLAALPGMLEVGNGALGLAGGAGLAAGGLILAFESIIPKIETFIEKMDGAAESTKHAAEMMKAAYDQMQKLKEQPDEEEQTSAKVVKQALSGKKGMQIATGIEQSPCRPKVMD